MYGAYVVVIDIPHVVVVNIAIAGFVELINGLFKLHNCFCKNG